MMYKENPIDYNPPKMPRMRTIKQCAEYFEKDDGSAVKAWFILQLVKDANYGFTAWCKSGVKYLINLDELIRYFQEVSNAPRRDI